MEKGEGISRYGRISSNGDRGEAVSRAQRFPGRAGKKNLRGDNGCPAQGAGSERAARMNSSSRSATRGETADRSKIAGHAERIGFGGRPICVDGVPSVFFER